MEVRVADGKNKKLKIAEIYLDDKNIHSVNRLTKIKLWENCLFKSI